MDGDEFARFIDRVDADLAERGVPAIQRAIIAWMETTGRDFYGHMSPRSDLGDYEGENLYFRIAEWYGDVYPRHATFNQDWGHRWLEIRGECYRARMPIILNPTESLDPFEFLDDVTPELVGLLPRDERENIRFAFNAFFRQASDLQLCLTIRAISHRDLTGDLLYKGWSDLRTAGESFRSSDPTAVLFSVQQAAEKYLKALLVLAGEVGTEKELKKKFGHKVADLLSACSSESEHLAELANHSDLLAFDQGIRYHREHQSSHEVLKRLNYSYAICHAVAVQVLAASSKADAS